MSDLNLGKYAHPDKFIPVPQLGRPGGVLVGHTGHVRISTHIIVVHSTYTIMEKVNINTATAEELRAVSGIGPVFADRILWHRTEKGNFKDIHELTFVRLLGPNRMQNLIPQIRV